VFRVWLLEGEVQASVLWSSPLSVTRLRLICSTHSTHGAPADVHLFINPLASHHVCFILHLISYHLISSRLISSSDPIISQTPTKRRRPHDHHGLRICFSMLFS